MSELKSALAALPEPEFMWNPHLHTAQKFIKGLDWDGCSPLYTAAQLQQAVEQAKPIGGESVLVDGVAYDIPAPVAAELLRLNIELMQAQASTSSEEFKPAKHYARRNHMDLDKAGGYFIRHMSAMTGEGLHGKADIAAELAWRDSEIDRLQAQAKTWPPQKTLKELTTQMSVNEIAIEAFHNIPKK